LNKLAVDHNKQTTRSTCARTSTASHKQELFNFISRDKIFSIELTEIRNKQHFRHRIITLIY